MTHLAIPAALATLCSATAACATISVAFVEGAPKDRFVITSTAPGCVLEDVALRIDLAGSAGGLIFDTSGAGAGVEVFQPFDLVEGADLVAAMPKVDDGDQEVSLALASMPLGARVVFTIDVDDTIGAREITVAGSEIVGAEIEVAQGDVAARATFDASATAALAWPDCTS